jgi:flagellar basal-body rod protein FlgB
MNGNNVNMDQELVEQSETLLRTQLVVQALNHKYSVLRTAIVGQ